MRMDDLKVDIGRLEDGDWVDGIPEMGALRLKTRGIGNKQWRKLQAKLNAATPRNKRDDPDEMERILATLIRDTALLDWDGIEGPDGKPLPFSKDQANEYLTNPEYDRKFFNAAVYAASVVADKNKIAIEEDAKNS